jgi:hypothetical protein
VLFFISLLVDGLLAGAIYALIALAPEADGSRDSERARWGPPLPSTGSSCSASSGAR